MSPRQQLEKLRSRVTEERRKALRSAIAAKSGKSFDAAVTKIAMLRQASEEIKEAIKREKASKGTPPPYIGSPIQVGAKS